MGWAGAMSEARVLATSAPSRRSRRAGIVALAAIVAALLYACAGLPSESGTVTADEMLLSATDFTGLDLREAQRLGQRETRDGGLTAQVALENDRIRLFQSVIVFPTEGAARTAFEAIDQTIPGVSGETVPVAPTFGQESLVFVGRQGTSDAVSSVFRQGRILVRLTLTGTGQVSDLLPMASKAEAKAKRRRSSPTSLGS